MGKGTLPPIPRGYQSIQPEQRETPPLPEGYQIESAEKKKSDGVLKAFSGISSASTSVPQLESGEINSILGRVDKSPVSPQYIKQKEKFAKVLTPELEVNAEEFDADPVSVASKVVLSKIPQVKRYDQANNKLSAAPPQPIDKQVADKEVVIETPKAELTSGEGLQAIRDVKNYYSNNTNTSLSHLSKISGIDNADDFYDDRFDEQIKQSIRPGNQTDAIAYERLQDAKTARKVIASNLEQGRGLADMAVDYAAATNPDMAAIIEQLKSTPTFEEAISGKESINRTAEDAFDNATIGRFLYDMLNSTAIAQEAEKIPGLMGKLNSESNSLIFKYPDFGKMYLGNKISQKMEDMGLNNAILNVATKEERDKAVAALVAEGKMTPLEERFYKDEIRPLTGLGLLRRKIAGKPVINTTGFIESGAESLYGGARDIPKGIYELTGLRESVLGSQGALREDLEAANKVVGVKPKNLAHEISMNAGQFLGQSLSIGGGSKLLNNLKLAKDPRTVMGMLGGVQAYANYMPQARMKFPGDELKQRGYATILGAIEWKTENIFNDRKIIDGLMGKLKPGVAETIQDFTTKKISAETAREQMQSLIAKAIKDTPEAVKYFGKAVLQNDIEEISAELGQQVTSGVFENKPFNEWINGEDLWQTARMATLGSPIIGGLSARADMQKNRGITAKNIYSMAQDPEYWKGQITEAAKLDKDIAAEAEDKIQNIDRAAQIYQELQSTDLTEKQKVKYLITELEKNVKQKEAEAMAIPALQNKAIQGFEKVQQDILDGNDDGTIEGDVSDELTPDETKAVKIAAKEGLPGIYGEIDPLDGVKGIAYQAQGITEDAEGNITEVEGGGRTEDLLSMGVSQDLIDAAVKAFPNPQIDQIRELDMGTEQLGEEKTTVSTPVSEIESGGEVGSVGVVDVVKEPMGDNELQQIVGRDVFKQIQRSEEQLGEGVVDRNRMIETAKRIQKADKKDKLLPEHIFEALQYETGFPDNWQDLRNAIKKGGIDINSEAVQRQIEVGVKLPKDIVEEFKKSERYKNANPELVKAVESLLSKEQTPESIPVERGEGEESEMQIVEINDWDLPDDELSRNAAYILIKAAMRDGDIVAVNKDGEEMSIKSPSQTLTKTKTYQYNPEIDYFKAKTDKGRQILSQLNAEYVARERAKNETPNKQEVKTEPNETTKESIVTDGQKPAIEKMAAEEAIDKDSGAAGQEPPKTPPAEPVEWASGEATGITHAANEVRRKDRLLPEYEKSPQTFEQWNNEAEKAIKEGYDVEKLMDEIEAGKDPNPVENAIRKMYVATLDAEIAKNPTDELLAKQKRFIEIGDLANSRAGRNLVSLKGDGSPLESISDFYVAKMEAAGVDKLTDKQKKETKEAFDNVQNADANATAAMEAYREEIAKLKAENEVLRQKKEASKSSKPKTKEDFIAQRKSLREKLKQQVEEFKAEGQKLGAKSDGGLGSTIITIKMAKTIGEIAKSYIDEVGVNLKEVVKRTFEEVKDLVSGITEKDIHDVLAGEYKEERPTRNELAAKMRDLKDEAFYINKLERLIKGEEPKKEKEKVKRNQQITDLQKKIKELQKELPPTDADLKRKLSAIKTKNENEAEKIKERISKGDFENKKPVPFLEDPEMQRKFPKEYKAALDAIVAREEARHEFDIALMKDQMARRSIGKKGIDLAGDIIGTTKALVTGIDASGIGIQNLVAMVAHPRSAAKALPASFGDFASAKRMDRWLASVHSSSIYPLAKKAGLDITEPKSLKANEREELFTHNLLDRQIKYKGKTYVISKYITKPFERIFTGLGNRMRWNLWQRGVEKLQNEGYTWESHPEEYKSLAKVLNTETGRGTLHKQVENAYGLVSAGIWSPRLMASRLNILGLGDLGNLLAGGKKGYYGGLTPRMREYAIKDFAKFVVFGALLMAAAGLSFADDVELDPNSSTFGTFEVDGRRYNIWGGFTQYVRLATKLAVGGERKSDGTFQKTDQLTTALRFLWSKTTPAVGTGISLLNKGRRDYMGQPVTKEGVVESLLVPLSIRGIAEGIKKEGAGSIIWTGIPSFVGMNVSYQDKFDNKEKAKETKINF